MQIGAFSNRANAERMQKIAAGTAIRDCRLVRRDEFLAVPWRVLIGEETTEEAAQALARHVCARSSATSSWCGWMSRPRMAYNPSKGCLQTARTPRPFWWASPPGSVRSCTSSRNSGSPGRPC